MKFGDEYGLFWETAEREKRVGARAPAVFDHSRISVESSWTPPTTFPELSGIIGLDLETHDPDIKTVGPSWAWPDRGKVVGFAIAVPERAWYFPTQHEGGGNVSHTMTKRWLQAQLRKPGVEIVTANGPYDLGWLWREGIEVNCPVHDVQVQMAMLDEHRFEYGLDSIGFDILGVRKNEDLMTRALEQAGITRDAKSYMWRLHSKYVGPYAEQDARLTLDLFHVLHPRILAEDMAGIYEVERKITPIVTKMRARGVRTDPERADEVRSGLLDKEGAIAAQVKSLTGVAIDAWDKTSIVRALKAEGVEPPKTKKGEYSLTKEWLEDAPGTVAGSVRQLRVYNKARTTFVDGHILRHSAHDGRIHCSFHQLRNDDDDGNSSGTITGRFSSSGPNLQQIPKRNKEIQKLIRTLLLPDEGTQWGALDFSSQEPRLILHFADLANVAGGAEAVQRYLENPRTDYHQMVADFCGITRDEAKPINLGIGYGMGGAKLCRSLGLPTSWCVVEREGGRTKWREVVLEDLPDDFDRSKLVEVAGPEGKAILAKYHEGAPFIKGMIDLAMKRGDRKGFIRTILGRRARFQRHPKTNQYMQIHAALNKLAQGSAADQMKRAMVLLNEELGEVPLVTVHDEVGVAAPDYGHARRCANLMELAIELRVPSIIDVKLGDNWGEVRDADPTPSMGYGRLAA